MYDEFDVTVSGRASRKSSLGNLSRSESVCVATMSFSLRLPSTNWEPVPISSQPPLAVWGWFKPPQAPNSVVLQTPPELWRAGQALTVRHLAAAAGIEALIGWTVYGQHMVWDEQTAALLDLPLPCPAVGGDAQVILWSAATAATSVMAPPVATPAYSAPGAAGDLRPGEDPGPLFDLIASYWSAIQHIEIDVRRARKQLEQALARLTGLNRDLNTEEAAAADNLDKKDWQDARRWLRDGAAGLSRCIKEIDIGALSGAGQRHRFEDIFNRYVQPRIPFPGLQQAVIDFEMHQKTAQSVLQSAQSALSKGSADGERRANAVLQRIAGKIRQRRNKARGMNA